MSLSVRKAAPPRSADQLYNLGIVGAFTGLMLGTIFEMLEPFVFTIDGIESFPEITVEILLASVVGSLLFMGCGTLWRLLHKGSQQR